jgi:hypothetical protein
MATIGQGVRGIADGRAALLSGDTPGTYVDIVGIKSLSVEVTSDSDEQRGDDVVLMIVQENKALDISISSAFANHALLAALTGTTLASTNPGTSTEITTFSDPAAANTAYVQLVGQARGRDANNSALRITIKKAQVTGGPNLDFGEGAWLEPALNFRGVGRGDPAILYDLTAYGTWTEIA